MKSDSTLNKYHQLVNQLRERIVDGRIPGGTKLVSSREFSSQLNLSRSIVIEAYEQLKMEGYLEARHGSGTFVRPELVWKSFRPAPTAGRRKEPSGKKEKRLSFSPGAPDMSLFPRRKWLSCYHDAVEYASPGDLGYAPFSGRWDLREAIAGYLNEAKGILTGPERIIITAGSSQAFALLMQAVENPRVVLEDPQAGFVYRIFEETAKTLRLVPADDQGILARNIPDEPGDYIYVTPSHQFPLGGTLSAERRISLLKKAQKTGAWIIEDDFDSEFRYLGNPVPPLQVMAPERVVYIGTFSKIVSPSLRIGFMVLPEGLMKRIKGAKRRWDFRNEGLQQKAMALFIKRNFLSRHISRAHRSYGGKNRFLQEQIRNRLSPRWKISGATTGMHLVLFREDSYGRPVDAGPVAEKLRRAGFDVPLVSSYCRSFPESHRHQLLVAFGDKEPEELEALIQALERIEKEASL